MNKLFDMDDEIIHGELYVLDWFFDYQYDSDGNQQYSMKIKLVKKLTSEDILDRVDLDKILT